MPIPQSRAELVELVGTCFAKLDTELDEAGPKVASLGAVGEWTVKDLLAVRAWWTERVVEWIEAGRRGELPRTPAPGYRWSETPRLNADIVASCRDESYSRVRRRLERGCERVLETIESLHDRELLDPEVFEWAGRWPLSRWISINTARQYTTARTYVRRALRERR